MRKLRPIPKLPPSRHAPSSLAGDVRGAAALEFALISLPFFALIVAILQITTTFFAQQTLESASDKAVRQLVVGAAQKSGMTKDQFKTLVCSKLPGFMKCANVMVDIRTAASFSAADTASPTITYDINGNPNNSWEYKPGASGEITIARVMYIWNVQAGPLGFDISTMSGSRRLLTSVNVFKTEPYS